MFRTELKITPSPEKIHHSHHLLTIGSCFAQVMGERFEQQKFNILINPFGTIFNPISIFRLLNASLANDTSGLSDIAFHQGVYFNHHLHSEISAESESALNTKVSSAVKNVHAYLKNTDYLIITLGTAFVYQLKTNGEIVANCHKVPADKFIKRMLTSKEIAEGFGTFYNSFRSLNTKCRIILTVSPVRHIKDTIPVNSVSKSLLRVAAHELSGSYPDVSYFPAFEIMMDDLRDYRFYKEDMIHPTEAAEKYIWDKFSETWFSPETNEIIKDWTALSRALEHRPFRENSDEHKKFLRETLHKLELLHKKIDLAVEIESLRKKL